MYCAFMPEIYRAPLASDEDLQTGHSTAKTMDKQADTVLTL
jgi:hypothetical protein